MGVGTEDPGGIMLQSPDSPHDDPYPRGPVLSLNGWLTQTGRFIPTIVTTKEWAENRSTDVNSYVSNKKVISIRFNQDDPAIIYIVLPDLTKSVNPLRKFLKKNLQPTVVTISYYSAKTASAGTWDYKEFIQ